MTLNKLRALTENERYSGGGGGLSCSQVCEGAVGEISSIKAKSDFASSLMRGRKIIALRVVPHAAPASARELTRSLSLGVMLLSWTNHTLQRLNHSAKLASSAECHLRLRVSPV